MKAPVLRLVGSLVSAALLAFGLPVADNVAHAASTVEIAASAFGITSYDVQEITGTGDITTELSWALSTGGDASRVKIVHIPAGSYTVNAAVRFQASHLYLVAEPSTMVTLTRTDSRLLILPVSAVGVYGGAWNAARHTTNATIQVNGASASLMALRAINSAHHGISAYAHSVLRIRGVTVTGSVVDGVHLESSSLGADKLTSTRNLRNGVQLSTSSRGTITNSVLDANGLAVSGTTTGKTGHGLGLAGSVASVVNTSMSANKVCGMSLVKGSVVTVTGGTLNRNGRHGLGTVAGVRATFIGTTVYRNGYNGLLATGRGTRVSVDRAVVAGSRQRGLSVMDHARASAVRSLIRSSGSNNISIGTRSTVTLGVGNVLRDAPRANGVVVTGKSKLIIRGSGNVISGNRQNGVYVAGSTVRISARVAFRSNRGNGILAASRASVVMVKCRFSGNGHKVRATSGARVKTVR